ncbi:MAG: mandelate racemase/muconate lactonizing enzyme family protein [Balneolaceae bacterium]|nr:mandelate racemase/muconate lactonizing enzyme family protein [Balneolaceae bacterium]
MKINRRNFLKKASLGAAGSPFLLNSHGNVEEKETGITYSQLDEILSRPVLKKELFSTPVMIEQVSLLRYGDSILCKVVSRDGAEGICVSNDLYMTSLYPIFVKRVQPFFIGKDAVQLEEIMRDVYLHNYKLQGLALWLPVATVELAMLGKIADKSMGELIGDIHQPSIPLYLANNNRGRSAEESIARIQEHVGEWPFKALKFKVAGRMHEGEFPTGRSERLIPLVRETFGDEMTLYTDANGGYSGVEAIEIGKLMEEYNYGYFEEPVPFDWYEETKQVADTLEIPVAGGEQEPSLHNFRWLIKNNALQVVQPDQFYFGGMIPSVKVARMADAAGIQCTPHMSGPGLGYLYMMHFVSILPNAALFHEFKGFNQRFEMECPTSSLTIDENGAIKVPTGPGLGVIIDPDFIEMHEIVKA